MRLRLSIVVAASLVALPSHAAVKISTKPTQNMGCVGGVCTPTAKMANLNAADLANMLSTGNVEISSGQIAQDIDIDAAFNWTSTSRLTLDAYGSIVFNKPVVVAGTGALTITTSDGGRDGDFRFFGKGHVEFWDIKSDLTINGAKYFLVKNVKQIAKDYKHWGGNIALSRSMDAAKDGVFAHPLVSDLIGTIEGLGNTISNLSIDDVTDNEPVGFVGTTYDGYVRDLNLVDANVTAGGTGQVAGVLMGVDDTVTDQTPVSILNCAVSGRLFSGGNSIAGGLAGELAGFVEILHSHADVVVLAGPGSKAGGLVGYSYDGRIIESYSTGTVFGDDGSDVGSLVGENLSPDFITSGEFNSYATGSVTGGNNALVGGLVGLEDQQAANGSALVTYSYSTAAVSAGSGSSPGGLIGYDTASGFITASYWDLDTSGISNPSQGSGNMPNDPGILGLSDTALRAGLPSGFDPNVWGQSPTINNGYPYLLANPPPQ